MPKRIIKVSIIITWPRFILWQSSLSLVVQIALQVSEVIRVTRSLAQKCLRCEIRREENSSASTDPIRHLPARPLGRYELYYPLAWNMLPLPPPSSSLRAEILEPRMQHLKFFINALVAAWIKTWRGRIWYVPVIAKWPCDNSTAIKLNWFGYFIIIVNHNFPLMGGGHTFRR